MKKTRQLIEVNQTVFVTTRELYYKVDSNLTEYVVVKANKSSFYAHPVGRPMIYPIRFSQKNMSRRDMGQVLEVYLSASEYWGAIKERQELHDLQNNVINKIKELDIAKLRQIEKLVNRKYITDKQIDKMTKAGNTRETESVRN